MKGGFFMWNGKLVITKFIHLLFLSVDENLTHLIAHSYSLKRIYFTINPPLLSLSPSLLYFRGSINLFPLVITGPIQWFWIPRILIRFLIISCNFESFKNTPILQNILHNYCKTGKKTHCRCVNQKQTSNVTVKC